jgi:hypothetical protein
MSRKVQKLLSRKKEHTNYGAVQLVLLAQYLEKNSFDFWNLGASFYGL